MSAEIGIQRDKLLPVYGDSLLGYNGTHKETHRSSVKY
jgi:hypothetical protein